MKQKKNRNSFVTIIVIMLLILSSAQAQQKTETQQTQNKSTTTQTAPEKAPVIKIYGVKLIILSSPDKVEISRAPVNNTGAGGFKVSKAGTYFIKAVFGRQVDEETIKSLNIDIKYPDGTKKTVTTTPASNGKSVESAEFEWTEPSKPLFAYLTSTLGKVNTPPVSEAKKK